MPIVRVQNFIYRNMVKRNGVNHTLGAFGRALNFLRIPYATGLTRNKARLWVSSNPEEVHQAENALLNLNRLRASEAVYQIGRNHFRKIELPEVKKETPAEPAKPVEKLILPIEITPVEREKPVEELTPPIGKAPSEPAPPPLEDAPAKHVDEPALPIKESSPEAEIVIHPEAIELRDRVRNSDKILLFTRNMGVKEFSDIVEKNKLVPNGDRFFPTKYYRYGLGHEYGNEGEVIVFVMKRGLWDARKKESVLKNGFLGEVAGRVATGRGFQEDGGGRVWCDNVVRENEDREDFLRVLAGSVDYNRNLKTEESGVFRREAAGMSIAFPDKEKYMGLYPQLEVVSETDVDKVEKILVPEHMWDRVNQIAEKNPQVKALLVKVDGTGPTKEQFLEGRDLLGRRSRGYGGGLEPNFGHDSFHLFEQAYFKLVLNDDYHRRAVGIIESNGYRVAPGGWIYASSHTEKSTIARKNEDWKIFVNPGKERFFEVLDIVLEVLDSNELAIPFKVPTDLSAEWRPGRKYSDSNSPKIVIHLNQEVLPLMLQELNYVLVSKFCSNAGFGENPGPSFARRWGANDLLFYKKEYFDPEGDSRAVIADRAENAVKLAGRSDPEEILRWKQKALADAGFSGENFYMRAEDTDPLEA